MNPSSRQLRTSTPTLRGVGLFTGVDCAVTFHPGQPGGGLVFRSLGPNGPIHCPARIEAVAENPALPNVPRGFPVRNTTLTPAPQVYIGTVEHAMSALRGLGIIDCLIEVEGPEVPIFDGSALAFVEVLRPRLMEAPPGPEPLLLNEPVTVHDGHATITATPRVSGCSYTYILDYGPGSHIPPQRASWCGDPDEFCSQLAPARTFSLEREAAIANAVGLFSRFTPHDLLVIGNDGRPIDNEWRFENEAARHKLLDLIGDMGLLGRGVRADIVAEKSGHALTERLCRELLPMAAATP